MEDVFFKSALPTNDSLALGDSSLALPGEPTPRSSSKGIPDGRSLRVQQQVQLTLSRRARKTKGNVLFHVIFTCTEDSQILFQDCLYNMYLN